jgi:hypothetical protein
MSDLEQRFWTDPIKYIEEVGVKLEQGRTASQLSIHPAMAIPLEKLECPPRLPDPPSSAPS